MESGELKTNMVKLYVYKFSKVIDCKLKKFLVCVRLKMIGNEIWQAENKGYILTNLPK
jgi:hypothetical protein